MHPAAAIFVPVQGGEAHGSFRQPAARQARCSKDKQMLEPSTVLQPSRPLLWHPQGGFVGGKKAKRAQPASLEGLCVLEAFCGDNCVFPTSMVHLAWVPIVSRLLGEAGSILWLLAKDVS